MDITRMIAIFMGWYNSPYPNLPNKMYILIDGEEHGLSLEQFDYDTNWNTLKEVVDKIYDITSEHDQQYSGNVIFEYGIGTSIEDVYNAIVQYINWYNKHKVYG